MYLIIGAVVVIASVLGGFMMVGGNPLALWHLNEVIVIGGDVGEASPQLLAGVREVVFQRSLPLATEQLRVVPSGLSDRAGVIGAAIMAIEHVLAPDAIDRAIRAA